MVLISTLHVFKSNKSKTSLLVASELKVFGWYFHVYYMMTAYNKVFKTKLYDLQFCSLSFALL